MKLKYTTRHLNFYFLKIHILRLLFCVYIVGMAGFVLASRRNDGQETKDGSKVERAIYDLQMKTLLEASDHIESEGLNNHILNNHLSGNDDEKVLDNGVALGKGYDNTLKTLFPKPWSNEKIVKVITLVLHSPEILYPHISPKNGPTLVAERTFTHVTKKGNFDIFIRVITKKSDSKVITAYPLYQ